MPGDELHDNAAAGARSGPRHAAPKKPLLTRLHVPAGKAIAIAAMPSAVLMGMGLTPQMAIAKPAPKSPFKDGPCVTAPDKVEKDSKDGAKDEKDDTKPSATPSAKPSPSESKEHGQRDARARAVRLQEDRRAVGLRDSVAFGLRGGEGQRRSAGRHR